MAIAEVAYLGEILSFVTAVTWAFAVILFRKAGEAVHPLGLNLFKNLLAMLLFIPTWLALKETAETTLSVQNWLLLFASGALGIGLGDTFFFMSLNRLGASLVAIVDCLYSPLIIALSMVWLGESMRPLQYGGAFLIVASVFTISYGKRSANLSARQLISGIFWGILALVAMAVAIVMIKPLLEVSPLVPVTEIRLFGGVVALSVVLAFHPQRTRIMRSVVTATRWRSLVAGSFVGAYVSMLLWLGGMKLTKASVASALNQTTNILIFVFAAIFLKEPLTARRVGAITVAALGTYMVIFG